MNRREKAELGFLAQCHLGLLAISSNTLNKKLFLYYQGQHAVLNTKSVAGVLTHAFLTSFTLHVGDIVLETPTLLEKDN